MPTTPFMGMNLPAVSSTSGPQWASDLNNALTNQVDDHDHTSGNGVPIPTAGLNINADLEFNSKNAIELRSTRFDNQGSLFSSASDNRSIFVFNGEVYFRDNSGNNVKITNAGAVNVSGSNGIGGDYGGANPASVFYTDATDLYSFTTDPGVFANLKYRGLEQTGKTVIGAVAVSSSPYTITTGASDANYIILVDTSSSRTVNMPDPTTEKRVVIVKDGTGQSETNNITLAPNASETFDGVSGNKILANNWGIWEFISNGTNWVSLRSSDVSRTVFKGSDSVGGDTIPTTFASPTLSAAALFKGLPVSRSTNTINFPLLGKWKATLKTGRLSFTSVAADVLAKMRNTSAGSDVTVATGGLATGDSGSEIFEMYFTVTSVSTNYELQWAASGGGTTTSSANTVDSATGPRWQIEYEWLGR